MTRPAAQVDPTPLPDALVLVTASADQTRRLARAMAPLCRPGDVVLLVGDLGAGKTTFAQGFGAALGVTEPITSPTFVLVRQYPMGDGAPVRVLVHADVYRLDRLHEIVELGLGELVDDGGVALVEWGDAAQPVLGSGALTVKLAMDDDDDRRVITISALDGVWSGRWDGLAQALGSWRADP
ncbi:MAG: tRNA (adenosine(37)-N6)-threonylcarbamoyltransferase complex ATPase subunit type 1 TsaE [Acidimicrobiales bacterium]|jgi:tRNA threonylcarbamoyladenosine biosynthesis protein TsaE